MSFWSHLSAEASEGARVTWYWGSRAGALVLAVHLIAGAAAALLRTGGVEERAMAFATVGACGLAMGILAAVTAGLTALVRRLAGWGLVVPLVLVPVGIVVACWLGGDLLSECAAKLTVAMQRTDPHATAASIVRIPLLYVFAAPVLFLWFLTDPAVFVHAFLLYYFSLFAVTAGALGGAIASSPVLLIATVRRLRHRAQKRDDASSRKMFGDDYLSLADARPAA